MYVYLREKDERACKQSRPLARGILEGEVAGYDCGSLHGCVGSCACAIYVYIYIHTYMCVNINIYIYIHIIYINAFIHSYIHTSIWGIVVQVCTPCGPRGVIRLPCSAPVYIEAGSVNKWRQQTERLAEYGWKPHRVSLAQKSLALASFHWYMRDCTRLDSVMIDIMLDSITIMIRTCRL